MEKLHRAKNRILVTFGYHLKELFAEQVGMEFRKLDLENVVVARFKGIRGLNRLAKVRRDVGAKYGIDLHDNTPSKEKYGNEYSEEFRRFCERMGYPMIKYQIIAHMGYERALKLLSPFVKGWNEKHGANECYGEGCSCYYLDQIYYKRRKPCRANILCVEYYVIPSEISVSEGVEFLKSLVQYLQSQI